MGGALSWSSRCARRARSTAALASLLGAACASDPASSRSGASVALEPEGPLALGTSGLPMTGAGAPSRVLAGAGLRSANAPCRLLRWSRDAAAGDRGDPRWEPLDAWVRELQRVGYRDLELCIELAAEPRAGLLLAPRSPLPPPERHAELAAWIGGVVERYDRDGTADAAGLLAAVNRFRIGSDLAPGGIEPFDSFPALLARVRREMRVASPAALLVLPPLRASGRPPGPLAWRIEALAAEPLPFDAWSVEASGSADELDAWLAWLAERTPSVPIEIVGGTSRPFAETGAPTRCDASAAERAALDLEIPEGERCALAAVFVDLLARAPDAVAWARAVAARDLVQKAIVAAGRGVARAELASLTDAGWWIDPSLEAGAGLAAWSGLLDSQLSAAHPAFYALRQVAGVLRDRSEVAPAVAVADGVRVYALYGAAGPAWVAWYEPSAFVGPGNPPPSKSAAIDVGFERVRLEQVITEPGTSEPLRDDREIAGGRLWIDLTPTPLFIVPERGE